MKKLLFVLFFLASISGVSQLVNSKEKKVADFYNADVNQLVLKGGEVSIQIRLGKLDSIKWISTKTSQFSAIKEKNFYIDLGLTNTKSFLNLNSFDIDAVGFKGGLTFQNSFNTIIVDSTTGNPIRDKLFTQKYSTAIQFDRFKNFDPATNLISNPAPVTVSVNANWNYYLFNKNIFGRGTLIPSLNLELIPITSNLSTLSNYISSSSTTTQGDVIFTSSSSFDGKYGTLDRDIQSSFISFSLPYIFDKKSFNKFHLAPTPFFSTQFMKGSKPAHNFGLLLGIMSSSIMDNKKTEELESMKVDGKVVKYRKFNVPSFLSIGVDWVYLDGKGSSPNYFITGSFTLD